MGVLLWFRRDLRIQDNQALRHALAQAEQQDTWLLPVFVLDPRLIKPAGAARLGYLAACLQDLHAGLREIGAPGLHVLTSQPERALAELATNTGADDLVHAHDFGPYGQQRDRQVGQAMARIGRNVHMYDLPYLHRPGAVTKNDRSLYRVFTPFYKRWAALAAPAVAPTPTTWAPASTPIAPGGLELVKPWLAGLPTQAAESAGSRAAHDRLTEFLAEEVQHYGEQRDRPDLNRTSRLSAALKYGTLHPRTVLAAAQAMPGSEPFIRQLAWRDFYAQVLFDRPDSAHENYVAKFDALQWASGPQADDWFAAWALGRTGYPLVDAGMRQLQQTGWMHNRVRMVVASFLTKDLHIAWQRGARHFMAHLVDGDLASNAHGWQWAAGTGTDASPYYRIFNPVSQGEKYDPSGHYVRRWIPELRHLPDAAAHQPWAHEHGYRHGYPRRIVDHAQERAVALAMLERTKSDEPGRSTTGHVAKK